MNPDRHADALQELAYLKRKAAREKWIVLGCIAFVTVLLYLSYAP